jgi:hypothetical protein
VTLLSDIEIIGDKSIQKELKQSVFHTRQSARKGGTIEFMEMK